MELTHNRNSVNKNIHNSETMKSLTKIHEANMQVPTENKKLSKLQCNLLYRATNLISHPSSAPYLLFLYCEIVSFLWLKFLQGLLFFLSILDLQIDCFVDESYKSSWGKNLNSRKLTYQKLLFSLEVSEQVSRITSTDFKNVFLFFRLNCHVGVS